MKAKTILAAAFVCVLVFTSTSPLFAQGQPTAEQLKKLAAQGYESDPKVLKEVATGGTPMGRWKEGLTFEGVAPMPWLKSATNWFPKTEEVQPDEIRVTFMGSSPLPRPGQMGTSVYVELGNGDNFIFDMGPGSIANYLAAGVPLNRLNNIFLTHLHWDQVSSQALSPGKHTVIYEFKSDGGLGKGGIGTITIDGNKVGEGRIDKTQPGIFSVDDLADVGTDDGTQVTDYGPSRKFTGTLNKLTIKTSG